MPSSNFKLFDENKQNMLSDEAYNINTQRLNGVQQGVASSQLQNKSMYQQSLMSYALAQLMVENGVDASDEVAVSTFISRLGSALVQKTVDKANTTEAADITNDSKYLTPAKAAITAAQVSFTKEQTLSSETASNIDSSDPPTTPDAALNKINENLNDTAKAAEEGAVPVGTHIFTAGPIHDKNYYLIPYNGTALISDPSAVPINSKLGMKLDKEFGRIFSGASYSGCNFLSLFTDVKVGLQTDSSTGVSSFALNTIIDPIDGSTLSTASFDMNDNYIVCLAVDIGTAANANGHYRILLYERTEDGAVFHSRVSFPSSMWGSTGNYPNIALIDEQNNILIYRGSGTPSVYWAISDDLGQTWGTWQQCTLVTSYYSISNGDIVEPYSLGNGRWVIFVHTVNRNVNFSSDNFRAVILSKSGAVDKGNFGTLSGYSTTRISILSFFIQHGNEIHGSWILAQANSTSFNVVHITIKIGSNDSFSLTHAQGLSAIAQSANSWGVSVPAIDYSTGDIYTLIAYQNGQTNPALYISRKPNASTALRSYNVTAKGAMRYEYATARGFYFEDGYCLFYDGRYAIEACKWNGNGFDSPLPLFPYYSGPILPVARKRIVFKDLPIYFHQSSNLDSVTAIGISVSSERFYGTGSGINNGEHLMNFEYVKAN